MNLVYLFTPGDNRARLDKAAASGADAVIADLEDGVAASLKVEARRQTASFLQQRQDGALFRAGKVLVRCNPIGSPHADEDVRMAFACGADAIMLPKCEDADDIRAVSAAAPGLELVPLIESARGVRNLEQIAAASPHIRKVAFGAVDFALDLGADWSAEGTERSYAMGQVVLLSRVAGLEPPIDAVFPVLNDREAFLRDAELGRRTGFYGKMVIHPRHIEWVREAYQVSAEELRWSRQAVELYESTSTTGSVQLEGKLIDWPVYTKAKRVLMAHADTDGRES